VGSESVPSQSITRQVLADHVYEAVLAALMDGRYEPGAGLSIDGLARDLAVSPTPVREALARLEATGMVHRVALKGYRVAPLFTPDELAQLMAARIVMEPPNAAAACARVTPQMIASLERAVTDLRTAPTGPSYAEYREYWQADERFHRIIAGGAGNRFLLTAYNSLGGQVQRFRFFSGLGVTDAQAAIDEHTRVIDAFRVGDPEGARLTMLEHIRGVQRRSVQDALAHG